MGPQQNLIQAIADQVVRDVAELPDRSSPEDWPAACLVTGEELHAIVVTAIEQISALPAGSVNALGDIIAERRRQIDVEGWSPEHDDAHAAPNVMAPSELAEAAACYAVGRNILQHRTSYHGENGVPLWPWKHEQWKPRDHRRNLIRAAALVVAEIERIDRALSLSGGA